jgi:hypothetical protein
MWSINLDEIIDLKRMVVLAVVSVLVFLVILIGSTVNQLTWNNFRHQFALNGYAVKLDKKFVVGVEEIIRAEEAIKLLESLSPYNPKAKDGNEIVLIKLKVQNIGKWTANLGNFDKSYGMQFNPEIGLYIKGADRYSDRIENLDLDLVDQGKYRNLNTWKVFEAGEIRDGLFGFEIPKGKVLQKLSFGYYFSSNGEIPLEPTPITKKDLLLIGYWIAYLLLILSILSSCWQRQNRSKRSSLRSYSLYFLVLFTVLALDLNLSFILIDKFILGLMFFSLIALLCRLYFERRNLVLQFSFLSKEDLAGIIKKFTQQMQWENPKINEWKFKTMIQSPETNEVYIFDREMVKVKKPTSDQKLVKEILLNLFCETRIDWYTFFGFLFQSHLVYLVYYFYFFIVFF